MLAIILLETGLEADWRSCETVNPKVVGSIPTQPFKGWYGQAVLGTPVQRDTHGLGGVQARPLHIFN